MSGHRNSAVDIVITAALFSAIALQCHCASDCVLGVQCSSFYCFNVYHCRINALPFLLFLFMIFYFEMATEVVIFNTVKSDPCEI